METNLLPVSLDLIDRQVSRRWLPGAWTAHCPSLSDDEGVYDVVGRASMLLYTDKGPGDGKS